MSIAILRGQEPGPSTFSDHSPDEIPRAVVSLLTQRAATAGKSVELRTFSSESDLIDCLRRANEAGFEFVLFDPGSCPAESEQLRSIMNKMTVPYIEVHDDRCGELELALAADFGPRLALIQGYGAQSYTLALSIALDRLGCPESENDVHVGI